MQPQPIRSIWFVIALAATTMVSPLAHAYPLALLDESRFGPSLDQLDAEPHELWAEEHGAAPLWFSVDVSYTRFNGLAAWSGMILVGLPLDRVVKHSGGAVAEETSTPRPAPPADTSRPRGPELKPAPAPKSRAPEPSAPPPPSKVAPGLVPTERIAIPVVVTPGLARAAVKAALAKAALLEPGARTDALASRARVSALLPELRLRVARIVDDGQSLVPTEYDPMHTDLEGGTTLWLDARATWRLDRLVFAQEEVALERIRNHRIEAQTKLVTRVLEALFAWQKALAKSGDQNAPAEDHLAAELEVLEAEAELDILTGGWFTSYRLAGLPKK